MNEPPFNRPPGPRRQPFERRGPMPPWGDPHRTGEPGNPNDRRDQADPRREHFHWPARHWDRRRSWGGQPFGPPGPPWLAHGRDWRRLQRGLFWRFAATFGVLMLLV